MMDNSSFEKMTDESSSINEQERFKIRQIKEYKKKYKDNVMLIAGESAITAICAGVGALSLFGGIGTFLANDASIGMLIHTGACTILGTVVGTKGLIGWIEILKQDISELTLYKNVLEGLEGKKAKK